MGISRLMEGSGAYSFQEFIRGHQWAFLYVLKGCFSSFWGNEIVCKLVASFLKYSRGNAVVCMLSASTSIITRCDL